VAELQLFKAGQLIGSYSLSGPLTLGRSRNADIPLPCDETSSVHAKVRKSAEGNWTIYDQNSKNGLVYLSQREAEIKLEEGVPVKIGSLTLQYFEKRQSKSKDPWNIELSQWVKKMAPKLSNTPKDVLPFTPAFELYFLKGHQAETRFLLGFGPRTMGPDSYDLPLFEENAPDQTLSFLPDANGVRLVTKHPKKVFLNNKAVTSEILNDEDIIKVGNTEIKVNFLDEFSY